MIKALFYDSTHTKFRQYLNPIETVSAKKIEDIIPSLQYIEKKTQIDRLFAIGYISYEASPAFDNALITKDQDTNLPLLRFSLYKEYELVTMDKMDTDIPPTLFPAISYKQYSDAIKQIYEYINMGDTYQINFTFQMLNELKILPFDFFKILTASQPFSQNCYLESDGFAIVSASPELFFDLRANKITCMPMKGTIKRGLTYQNDIELSNKLESCKKSQAENVMIVDMIRNDLGKIAITNSVKVDKLFSLEKYPTLWQMTSTISAQTNESLVNIFKALFPCASITGAPKVRAMEIINELEQTPRGVYTGAIGYIDPDRNAHFNVAIRTAFIDKVNNVVKYGVGSGIVADSNKDDEYAECLLKAKIVNRVLPDFEIFETIRYENGSGFHLLSEHLTRMQESAEYFDFQFDREGILEYLLTQNFSKYQKAKIKINLQKSGHFLIQIDDISNIDFTKPVKLALYHSPVNSENPFLYHKTTIRDFYSSALKEYSDFDDLLFWNQNHEITETSIGNVIVTLDGNDYTPPVKAGLLAGVQRGFLLNNEKSLKEKTITLEMLKSADNIYRINSVRLKQTCELSLGEAEKKLCNLI